MTDYVENCNSYVEKHIKNLPSQEFKPGKSWKDNSSALARWTQGKLLDRDDAYGYYYGTSEPYDGRRDAQSAKRDGKLSTTKLIEHYKGNGERIGLYCYDIVGGGKWCCVDIDAHKEVLVDNWDDVVKICSILDGFGIQPLIEHSNGKFGFHIWIIFTDKIDVAVLRSIVTYLIKDLTAKPEVFPKSR